jgi:hypothetical protein
VDSLKEELNISQKKNFERWPVLGQYVWPNPNPIPNTWDGEVNELLTWFENRLIWLDNKLEELTDVKEVLDFSIKLSPNPYNENTALIITSPIDQLITTTVTDINGKILSYKTFSLTSGYNEINFQSEILENIEMINSGLLLVKVSVRDKSYFYKLLK